MADRTFSFQVPVAGPVAVLPRRSLCADFKLAAPLLRALGPGEKPGEGLWSQWLAEWGWTWTISKESCDPAISLINIWLMRGAWPKDFDVRALSLAVALKLRVDGELLSVDRSSSMDLRRVWLMISGLSQDVLGNVLALALLRADSSVFDFDSIAPSWPTDVGLVISERRRLREAREPAPIWLKDGYVLLGETFSMLRSMGASLGDCDEIYELFTKSREIPLSFEMAFWWEASYCLTERHAYEGAKELQIRVDAIANELMNFSGLVDPMWHHQQGRLFYYAGNFEFALAEYLREFRVFGKDLRVAAMLNREISNVLSDLACIDAAEVFVKKSVDVARSQGQRSELYKSLGRWGEIAIKQGDLALAKTLFSESLSIQEQLEENHLTTAQTLSYLGHVANLSGELDRSAEFYEQALASDVGQASLPYITMGKFSLLAKSGNVLEIERIWNANRGNLDEWTHHQTHILPASVCVLIAARHVPQAKARLPDVVRQLTDFRYPIEAGYLLTELSEDKQNGIFRDVLFLLNKWQKLLGSFPQELKDLTGNLNGPSRIIEAIHGSRLYDDENLKFYCYPMTLAELETHPSAFRK